MGQYVEEEEGLLVAAWPIMHRLTGVTSEM